MKKRTSKLLTILLSGILSLASIQKVNADQSHLYDFLWLDPDKKVYVLQNKTFEKKGSFYLNLGGVSGLSNEFQTTYGLHFSTGYYFTEEWAIEAVYNWYTNSNNDAFENLEKINGSVPFVRRFNSAYGLLAVWSPFYGKINTFNQIYYFDWSFGLGIGQVETESNATTAADPNRANEFSKDTYTAALMKTELKFHVSESFHLGIEYFRSQYRAPGPTVNGTAGTDKWRSNSDLILKFGFSF